MPILYIILLVIVIAAGGAGIFLAIRMQDDQERKKKLAIIGGGSGTGSVGFGQQGVRDKRRADLAKKLKESNAVEKKASGATIHDMMVHAGISAPIAHFWIGSVIAGVVTALLSLFFGGVMIVNMLMFVVGFFGVPRLFLRIKTKKRQKKFLEDFADALESMVRLLKAGMPVGEAIAMVAREFHGPLGEEMSRVYENQRIGVPLGEAIIEMNKRMPLAEVNMFATGIVIQQQTGSSLSDVLLNLSSLIRARFRLRRKVQALSAEAKASAGIIGALPVVVSAGLYFINPDYIGLLFTTSSGKFYLTCAVCWMMIGMLIMRQMINFKV